MAGEKGLSGVGFQYRVDTENQYKVRLCWAFLTGHSKDSAFVLRLGAFVGF